MTYNLISIRKNNSTDFNQTDSLLKAKNLTNIFTDLVIKNYNTSTSNSSIIYQTNLLSIQISQSDEDSKQKAKDQALSKNLSLVDFSSCENYLKDNVYLNKSDVLFYSKTDWNPSLKVPFYSNANMTKANSVSYVIYAPNGTKINMDLCSNTTVAIGVYLNNLNSLNLTK